MKNLAKLTGCAMVLALLVTAAASAQESGEILPGRFIVTFRESAGPPQLAAESLSRAHGFQMLHVYRYALRGMGIAIPAGREQATLRALRSDPRVRAVGHDRRAVAFEQTVPKGVQRVFAAPGVAPNQGHPSIEVAVMDTGIDFNHLDLRGDPLGIGVTCIGSFGFWELCDWGGQDDHGHGTMVAGAIAALDNTRDLVGVAPQINLIAVKVLDAAGSGSFLDIIAGCDYIVAHNVNGRLIELANMSFGATCSVCTDNSTDTLISAFHDAVRQLVNTGTTVVVAAGNEASDARTSIPASFDEVITVSALADSDGQPGGLGSPLILTGWGSMPDDSFAKFSNFGADVDVIAPGVSETLLKLGGGTRVASGTSFSAPYTTGVAAIFIRDRILRGMPSPLPGVVRQALIESGECASGSGAMFHGSGGCPQVWPGDPDGRAEPLVRADNVINFGVPVLSHDVAVTSLSAPSPVLVGAAEPVLVGVSNNGTVEESFAVSLSDSLSSSISAAQSVTLAAGGSTTLTFSWTPNEAGTHVLTASASEVAGESNTSNNSKSQSVSVQEPVHNIAVNSLSAPASATIGDSLTLNVSVSNTGTFDETFTVSVNASPAGGSISASQEITLLAGASTTLNFTWDTSGAPAGDYVLTASAEAVPGESNTADNSASAGVTLSEPAPPPAGIVLIASGYKVKGANKADLAWLGATSPTVDVFRNGAKIATVGNTGLYTDSIPKRGGGSYTYKVCEAGTSTCSNEATVNF